MVVPRGYIILHILFRHIFTIHLLFVLFMTIIVDSKPQETSHHLHHINSLFQKQDLLSCSLASNFGFVLALTFKRRYMSKPSTLEFIDRVDLVPKFRRFIWDYSEDSQLSYLFYCARLPPLGEERSNNKTLFAIGPLYLNFS